MTVDPLTGLAVGVCTKLIGDMLSKIGSTLPKKYASKLKAIQNKKAIYELYEHGADLRMVKTIWQVSRPVDMISFYVIPKLVAGSHTFTPKSLSDILEVRRPRILIEGKVGHGKSLLMRYLASTELYRGEKIPLFIELRNITYKKGLHVLIEESLKSLGIACDTEEVRTMLAFGCFTLLLDGFDEINPELVAKTITELNEISSIRNRTVVVISSRPNSAIRNNGYFHTISMAALLEEDIHALIKQYCEEPEDAAQIIHGLNQPEYSAIKEILDTPLVISMLALHFCGYSKIPESIAQFYDAVFYLLLRRHDAAKPGFSRYRSSKLADDEIRRVFNVMCFLLRTRSIISGSPSIFTDLAHEASKIEGCPTPGSNFIDDIKKGTNLIADDGINYSFVHKSVQEYHAAAYIASCKDDRQSEKFYTSLLEHWFAWRQEIEFLRSIDRHRLLKFFALPSYDMYLKFKCLDDPNTPRAIQAIKHYLKDNDDVVGIEITYRGDFQKTANIYYPSGFNKLGWAVLGTKEGVDLIEEISRVFINSKNIEKLEYLLKNNWRETNTVDEEGTTFTTYSGQAPLSELFNTVNVWGDNIWMLSEDLEKKMLHLREECQNEIDSYLASSQILEL